MEQKGVSTLEFGSTLRKMRKGAGFSQEALAEKLHMSRSNISKLEGNKLDLRASDLINWCRITNNPDVLMALYTGAEVVNQLQPVTQMITGAILFLGGIAC